MLSERAPSAILGKSERMSIRMERMSREEDSVSMGFVPEEVGCENSITAIALSWL